MPVLDYDDELATAAGQNMNGAAAIGTKVKDAGAARDWGAGEPLVPYVRVTNDADSDVVTSMTFDFIASSTADLTGTPVVLSTISVLKAALVKNSLHACPPLKAGSPRRYLGWRFTPVGGNQASGARAVVGFMDKDGRPQDGVNAL
jgi:hypothetical protein